MRITTFNAVKNSNKKPKSPYDDKGPLADCFEFVTKEVDTLEDCFNVLSTEWILSNAICIEKPVVFQRLKKNITKLRCPSPGCIVVDIDNITSYDAMKNVIDYFKTAEFNIILGKSKNWDGSKKFNLKGFIECSFKNDWVNNRNFMAILNERLSKWCKIDGSASTDTSVQAPLFRNEVLLKKLDSTFKIDDDYITLNTKYIKSKKENEFIQQVDTSKLIHLCYEIYSKKGFKVIANRNDTLNWEHYSEVKSKGGYFTYLHCPHIMHHHQKEKSFNIFNEIKQTKEGQLFIKEQSAFALKKQFEEHKTDYNFNLFVNQPLFEINDKLKSFVSKFLVEGDILKIKSAMGTGKSWVIDEVISQSKVNNKRVLLLSNRISVAMDYSEKYNIKTYLLNGEDCWKPGEDLIVQMDSLFKYDITQFDIVILDEFVSLMFQTIVSMKEDTRPFNAVKFHSILKTKQIVMADAFLSGYEDCFYDNKTIFYIANSYRDEVDITYYESHNTFVESMLDELRNKDENETVTASIMSNNVINAIYDICTREGFKVFKLTANTSEDAKKLIYKLFEEDYNDKWDLLLFSPTLTVGVSNMNNCTHHFHYDGSNSADVISSLQMLKRSRKMKSLHIFQKERVLLEPTDAETLDDLFNQNIQSFFKGNPNGITIEVDENANFRLSPTGKFMNKIQALYNRLENNHKLSFNVLLNDQFKFISNNIIKGKGRLNFNEEIKKTKERLKNATLAMISDENFKYIEDIDILLKSNRSLSDNEKMNLMLHEIGTKVNVTDKNIIRDICKAEISSDFKMINHIYNLKTLFKKDILKVNNEIDTILSAGTKSNDFKARINILRDMIKLFNYKLESWYSMKNIREIDNNYKLNSFIAILKCIGYRKRNDRYTISKDVNNYFKYFL